MLKVGFYLDIIALVLGINYKKYKIGIFDGHIAPVVSEEYMNITTSIDNLMFKNETKMNNLRQITRVKKLEVRNARKFVRNFAKSIRNKVVTSIDKYEGDSRTSTFNDRGERIKYKTKTNSVLART
jgi:hypothetical protein